MLLTLSRWIRGVSTGGVALASLVVFIAFTWVVLPQQAASSGAAGQGAGSPDTSFLYSPGDLYRFAEAYGEAGRRAYVHARFTFDLVWPLVYGAFLCTATSWLSRRAFLPESGWQASNLVPLFGVVFDFLENFSTSLVMLRYPTPAPLAAALAPAFTLTKWLLVGSSFLLLLIGAFAWIYRRRSAGPGD